MALPTAATAWCRSGLSTAKHLLIPFCLGLGQASREGALASYAVLHGMALPVILFPAAPLASFAALLVPEVARSAAAGKQQEVEKAATTALSGTLYLSFAAATVLFLLAHPLSYTLYGSAQAGRYIRMLAPLIPIMYMDSATDAILKGLGKQVYCMVVNIGDAALCILFVLLLLPPFGADGYIAVICITEIYNFLFSFGKLTKLVRLPGRLWARSVFCLLWSILCALLTGALFGSPFSVGGMVLSGIFAVMVFGLGVFLFEEICMAAGLHFSRRCGKIKA